MYYRQQFYAKELPPWTSKRERIKREGGSNGEDSSDGKGSLWGAFYRASKHEAFGAGLAYG